MKHFFAVAAVAGLLTACLDVSDPITPDLSGLPEGIEEQEFEAPSEEAVEVLETVYHQVAALVFTSPFLEEFIPEDFVLDSLDITTFTQQLSDACADQIQNPPSSVSVPPVVLGLAMGLAEQVQAKVVSSPVSLLQLVTELMAIYDDNIVAVKANLPQPCHLLMVATGGYEYLPDTSRAFVTQLLDVALAGNLINAEQHELALLLLP